jgi:hypothetical protein
MSRVDQKVVREVLHRCKLVVEPLLSMAPWRATIALEPSLAPTPNLSDRIVVRTERGNGVAELVKRIKRTSASSTISWIEWMACSSAHFGSVAATAPSAACSSSSSRTPARTEIGASLSAGCASPPSPCGPASQDVRLALILALEVRVVCQHTGISSSCASPSSLSRHLRLVCAPCLRSVRAPVDELVSSVVHQLDVEVREEIPRLLEVEPSRRDQPFRSRAEALTKLATHAARSRRHCGAGCGAISAMRSSESRGPL